MGDHFLGYLTMTLFSSKNQAFTDSGLLYFLPHRLPTTSNQARSSSTSDKASASFRKTKMPFWSRSSADDSNPQESKDFTTDDVSGFTSSDTNFASSGDDPTMMAAATDIEQFSVALRQQMMVQTVINTLADKSFEKCITGKPGDSLSGKEVACVNATVCKWLDTNEFMNGRLNRRSNQ